jgi:1,5-anhydro-D-fructose reductase (1,5-anhydro-D-mannitol-forming)
MLGWLIAGMGDIVHKRVLSAIQAEPRSKLAGFLTRDPVKAERYGVPGWSDMERALAESGADAVYIATPVFLHAPQTIVSLQAGKHVLCEKPMALDYASACEMQRIAEHCDKLLGVAYYRRLYPKVARARELMEQGAIGRPVLVEATSHDWFNAAKGLRAWLADPAKAGDGPLRDVVSHRIDLINYLFGRPVRVCGQTSTLVQPVAVEDNVTALIEYGNGVRAVVDARWHSRIARDEFRIRGTEGELDLTPLNGPSLVHPGGTEQIPPDANLHYPCVENFVRAVLDGVPLVSSGATALAAERAMDQVAGRGVG